MKKFFLVILFFPQISLSVFAQRESVFFDTRNSEGMGLVLYSNGIFECDFRYEFLETGVDPVLFYSKGFWHLIDTDLIELKSFEEYKPKIENIRAIYNTELGDTIKIEVYNKKGNRIAYAYYLGEQEVNSYSCAIKKVYERDHLSQSYFKTEDVVILPYDLTYILSPDCNQYYFIVSSYPDKGYFSYHNCIIKILSEKDFRIIENRERFLRKGEG